MDLLNVVIRADTTGSDRAASSLDRMAAAGKSADSAVRSVATGSAIASGAIGQVAAATDRATASARAHAVAVQAQTAATRAAQMQLNNLRFQVFDVGQTLALGMNPLMVLLQQGPQIAQIYGPDEGGIGRAFRESGKMIGGFALAAWPAVAAMTALGIGVAGLTHEINETTDVNVGFMDTLKGIGQTLWATFTNFVKPITNTLGDLFGIAWDAVVTATKVAGNYIINTMVGVVKTIGALWNGLPAALADIGIEMANIIVTAFEGAINKARELLNTFTSMANEVLPGLNLAQIGKIELPKFANPYEGSKDRLGTGLMDIANENVDYMGGFFSDVRGRAIQNAMDRDKDAAKAAKEAAREAERQAKAYADMVLGANQFIETQQREASSLGLTAEAASRLRYEQEMLNKAANDNINLSASQKAEISSLAAAMAAAEEATRRITEIYNLGKDVFGGFFADMKSGLKEGQSFWEALGNAGANALDKIADRALSMAANGIFDMIFGAIMGGIGGGFGTIGVGGVGIPSGGFIPGLTGPKLFASGGYTGDMATNAAAGIVHGQEYVLNAAATRQIGIPTLNAMNAGRMPANQNQANDNGRIVFAPVTNISIGANAGVSMAEVSALLDKRDEAFREQLPSFVQSINAHPRQGWV